MIRQVAHPALKLHLDTFHMNIEEKNPAAAIRKAGASLGHFHACGSDRGTPGNDEMDWQAIAAAAQNHRLPGRRGDRIFHPGCESHRPGGFNLAKN